MPRLYAEVQGQTLEFMRWLRPQGDSSLVPWFSGSGAQEPPECFLNANIWAPHAEKPIQGILGLAV